MTNKKIQLTTVVDGQTVDVFPNTKSEFVEFADGKTLEDKINKLGDAHGHSNATPDKDGFMSKEDKAKLDNVTNYTHPSTHAATMITEDATHRFVTDAEKTKWDNKADTTMASKTNAGLMSASDKQRIDNLNTEFKTRDDKITKNTEDIKSWNDEMINKEYQYFNGENITIENSIISKTTDMIIKGRTLQNLIDVKKIILGDSSKEITFQDNIIKFKKAYPNEITYLKVPFLSKPNTTYTIIYDIIKNNVEQPDESKYIIYPDGVFGDFNSTMNTFPQNGQTGINKFCLNSKSTLFGKFSLGFHRVNVGAEIWIKDLMILEGDWTNKAIPSYFEGIKSFGQQENKISILSNGKNIFNAELEVGNIAGSGSVIEGQNINSNMDYARTKLGVKCKPNTSYVVSLEKNDIYEFEKTGVLNVSDGSKGKWIIFLNNKGATTSENIYFKCVVRRKDRALMTSDEIKNIKIQLEEGTQATNYEDYKENKKDILIKEPLRGFNNICDVIYEDNRQVKIDRYSNQYTFTGDEAFKGFETDGVYSKCTLADFNIKLGTTNILCNNFAYSVDRPALENQYEFISSVNSPLYSIVLCIKSSRLSTNNLEGYKAWLKANPTSIVYQLAEPTVEVLENYVDINLKTYSEKTYITSDNVIQGNLECRVPMNTAANLENDSTRLNDIESYIDDNKNNINKISKLEEGAVTSSLNIIDLQKEIINKDDYIKYEDKNIFINKNKEMQICNTIIKGDTLVNHILTPFKDKVYYGNSTSQRESYKVSIKPNTKYTIIADVVENSLNNNFSIISWKQTKDEQAIVIKPGQCGVIKKTYVSKDNDMYEYNTEVWRECTQGGIAINYMMILEGDWTEKDIPDYFEGIKGCGILNNNGTKIEIVNCSNNLFKELNFNIDPIGTNKIKLKLPLINKKSQYLISWDSFNITKPKDNWTPIIGAVYTDGTSLETYINQVNHIITDKNKTVEYFYYRNPWAVGCTINNLQIKEGSEMSPYEPYKERKKEILINEFLNSGDYLFQEENDLKIYKKTGNLILNGENEDWKVWDNNPGDTVNAYVYFNRLAIDLSEVIKPKSNILNDKLPSNQGGYLSTKEGFRIINNYFAISIHKSKLGITNVNDPNNSILIKNWLKSNPISVVYELNTPNVKTVKEDYSLNLNLFNGKNYISSLGAIKAELSFDVPRNIVTQNKENVKKINNLTNLFNDKTSKLEEAQLSTALNVLELQKHTAMLDNGEINEYKDHIGTFIECNNTLDSRTENMIIKGKTLVNLFNGKKVNIGSNSSFTCTYKDGVFDLNAKTVNIIISYPKMELEDNKKYTLICHVMENTLTPMTETAFRLIRPESYGAEVFLPANFTRGIFKTTFTTNKNNASGWNDTHANLFVISATGRIKFSMMVFEGDIDYIPYHFEGIKSLGEQENNNINLVSYTDNLLYNIKKVLLSVENGKESVSDIYFTSDFVYAPLLTYYKSLLDNEYILTNVFYYGKDKEYLYQMNIVEKDSFNNYPNAKYIRLVGRRADKNTNVNLDNVKIIVGSKKYTKYFESKIDQKTIQLKEPLCEDDFLCEDNKQIKVYRTKKQHTFTGNEEWNVDGLTNSYGFRRFYTPKIPIDKNPIVRDICDELPALQKNSQYDKNGITRSGSGYFEINIKVSDIGGENPENLKNWLKANPVTVIYYLTEPIIENIDSIDINVNTYKDKTYITTDNSIKGELEFKTQNNFGAIMKNVNRCISKIFNSLNNILNIKGE